MANTLTGLIPDAYAALNVVSRELVGYIPAVMRDGSFERAAVGQNVDVPIAPSANGTDISPAMTIPEPTDQTIGYRQMQITKSRAYEFGYVGEERRGLDNGGAGFLNIQAQQIAEAMRAITNEIETDIAGSVYKHASRATGVGGTVPFAANLSDSAQARKILDDNGAPLTDRHLILSTSAGANMRTLGQLTKANEAADVSMLRQGELLNLHGFSIRESGQAANHSAGSITANVTVTAAVAVGATAIGVTTDASGAVALVAGDVVKFAGDPHKYVVAADVTIGSSATGSITIQPNGLRAALSGNEAVTVESGYEANVAFTRSAIQLAVRAPALPEEGDLALDRFQLQDARSGLVFEMSVYGGYRKVRYEIAASWGEAVIKPEHVALLLG